MPEDRLTFEFKIETRVRENTHWLDSVHTFEPTETHLTVRRSDGREIHLYGPEADSVIYSLDLRRALSAPRLASELGTEQ